MVDIQARLAELIDLATKAADLAELQKWVDKLYLYCSYMNEEQKQIFETHCLKLAATKLKHI